MLACLADLVEHHVNQGPVRHGRESFAEWAQYFGVSSAEWDAAQAFDRTYLDAALRYGRDGTAMFGLRLMWESVGRRNIFYCVTGIRCSIQAKACWA